MDIAMFVGPIASAIMAFAGSYLAFTNRLTRLETMIEVLSKRVEEHNHVKDRTTRLEAEVDNLYHRYDDLKNDLKIGGTE